MPNGKINIALTALQWTMGIVIFIEAILLVMPGGRHDFAQSHMPDILRLVMGWAEIVGAVFLLIPKTSARGAWFLTGLFVLGILVHIVHGLFDVGYLAIYAAAAWAVAAGRAQPESL